VLHSGTVSFEQYCAVIDFDIPNRGSRYLGGQAPPVRRPGHLGLKSSLTERHDYGAGIERNPD
jgi:hypothetical protein